MKREKIAAIFADAQRYTEQEITVCGWVRTVRDMKNFGFIELNDGSCFKSLQVVFARETLSNYDEIARQNVGAALIVKGQLVLTPEAKQPFELKAAEIAVEGVSTPDYPLQKKRHSVEFLRTIQHLRPRTNLFSAVFRVRSVAAQAVHEFFRDRGFVYVQTPRPAERRELCHGVRRCLYLWSDLPRRGFLYPAACRGVLDDRAGNGLRGSA